MKKMNKNILTGFLAILSTMMGINSAQALSTTGFDKYSYALTYFKKDVGVNAGGNNNEDFSGVAFNPTTQKLFLTDALDDVILETDLDANRTRTISLTSFKDKTSEVLGAGGITWLSSNKYAFVLTNKKKLVITSVGSDVTSLNKSDAAIYDLPSDATSIQSLAYNADEDAFYLADSINGMKIYKVRPNAQTSALDVLDSFEVSSTLNVNKLTDIAFSKKISPHLLVLTQGPGAQDVSVKELVVSDANQSLVKGSVLSSFAFKYANVPLPAGMGFDQNGRLMIVGSKTNAVKGEYDFARYEPTPPLVNSAPIADLGLKAIEKIDQDGNGKETFVFNSSNSFDSDGVIIDYQWIVDGVVSKLDVGPAIQNFSTDLTVGAHSVQLAIRDDNQASSTATVTVSVVAKKNSPPVAISTVPAQVTADVNGVAKILVDASLSSDPDGDPITGFEWFENSTSLYDGKLPITTLTVTGVGIHQISLTVLSTDSQNKIQSTTKTYSVTVKAFVPANQPPIAAAVVPAEVTALANGSSTVLVDARTSSDPENDPVIRYTWVEGASTLYDGQFGTATLTLNGTGVHQLILSVSSKDSANKTQTATKNFSITVKPFVPANQPPVAAAVVPSEVTALANGNASISVDATTSSDPENDPIIQYTWSEGATTLYDGGLSQTNLTLSGEGAHQITLKVTSKDSANKTQSDQKSFSVNVKKLPVVVNEKSFVSFNYQHVVGKNFSFTSSGQEDFTGLTFNPLTKTLFMVDNKANRAFEIGLDGALVRTIDLSGFSVSTTKTADPEAITWMHGQTFAIVLQSQEKVAVVEISSTAVSLVPAKAEIFDFPSNEAKSVKGLVYLASEDAFYFVNEKSPLKVFKGTLNHDTHKVDIVSTINLPATFPLTNLSDVAYLPRLSPNLLLLSSESRKVVEMVISENIPGHAVGDVIGELPIGNFSIPQSGGLAFDDAARLFIVGQHVKGESEFDFSRFDPSSVVQNSSPTVSLVNSMIQVTDNDLNEIEAASVEVKEASDPDGVVIDYKWTVDGIEVRKGYGPSVENLNTTFALGQHVVRLLVRDDAQLSSSAVATVNVLKKGTVINLPPVASANVPAQVISDENLSALINVDATTSHDPENDPIVRYQWFEEGNSLYDGAFSTATLTLVGNKIHQITLVVSSKDSANKVQSSSVTYSVQVNGVNQPANNPPIAMASVPTEVTGDIQDKANIFVDASLSSDPEQDPITNYRWTENGLVLYDGVSPTASLNISGVGSHQINLVVTSKDSFNHLQTAQRSFTVLLKKDIPVNLTGTFVSHGYTQMTGDNFPFTNNNQEDFTGLTFSPVTKTLFVADNKANLVFEVGQNGILIKTIDLNPLSLSTSKNADPEGISWMYGETFAIVLQKQEAVAVVTISSTTTEIHPSDVVLYPFPKDQAKAVKGLTYVAAEDAFYFVNEKLPLKVFKGKLNNVTHTVDILRTYDLPNTFPVTNFSDVAYLPRISPNLLLLSSESRKIVEMVVSDLIPGHQVGDVVGEFSIAQSSIPASGGLAFDNLGKLYIVGQHVKGESENDFSRFDPSIPLNNMAPILNIGPSVIQRTIQNGEQVINLSFAVVEAHDPDGTIVDYEWNIDGQAADKGFGPHISGFTSSFPIGQHTVKLKVHDDSLAPFESSVKVNIVGPNSEGGLEGTSPVASAFVPTSALANARGETSINVDASNSYDIDGDPITRYQWLDENKKEIYSGPLANPTLFLNGVGYHKLTLNVFSTDQAHVTSTGSATYLLGVFYSAEVDFGNQPPFVSAEVPTVVVPNSQGNALIQVDASQSLDPEGSPITRYQWVELGRDFLYDGLKATTSFMLINPGIHRLVLAVHSKDQNQNIQVSTQVFTVKVTPPASQGPLPAGTDQLGGHQFDRVLARDFGFANAPDGTALYQNFSGLTFNPITRTIFMVDNNSETMFEFKTDGGLVRQINLSPLRRPGVKTADPEGITWMYGNTYGISLETPEELAVVEILPETVAITRNVSNDPTWQTAKIYPLPPQGKDPNMTYEGIAYIPEENAFYLSVEKNRKSIFKLQLVDGSTTPIIYPALDLENIAEIGDISEITYAPMISPHLLVMSHESRKIIELVVSDKFPGLNPGMVLGQFSLTKWPIPQPEGLTFDQNGTMYIVGEHVKGAQEDDFNVFNPTELIPNLPPVVHFATPSNVNQDLNQDGVQTISFNSSGTSDDSRIIEYIWMVDGYEVQHGFGAPVPNLTFDFLGGPHTVSLTVKDDAWQVSSSTQFFTVNFGPHSEYTFSQEDGFSTDSLNYIHTGSLVPRAEFAYEMKTIGNAVIRIYDLMNNQVAELTSPQLVPGSYRTPWDLTNGNGEKVASGTYHVLINAAGKIKKEKVVIVR